MNKKLVSKSILLVILLYFSLLNGCGKTANISNSKNVPEENLNNNQFSKTNNIKASTPVENLKEENSQKKVSKITSKAYTDSELISWDKIYSSSELKDNTQNKYLAQFAVDNDFSTAWVEGKDDNGIGEWINLENNYNALVRYIELVNGYTKSEYIFNANNRAKKILIEFSDGSSIVKELSDGFKNSNLIELEHEVETKSIKITLLDIFKGEKYKDTCISEIKAFGTNINKKAAKENEIVEKPSDLVNIKDIDNTIIVDLKYASEDNFTEKKIYDSEECYLRRGTAEKLAKANTEFNKNSYKIKIYDGYRPLEVQKVFWEIVHDSRYVAPPSRGSRHNRGASVDITLVDKNGNEIEMPSKFDDFSEKAWRNYTGSSEKAKENMNYLTKIMKKHGFTTINTEWWHFDDSDWSKYPIQ